MFSGKLEQILKLKDLSISGADEDKDKDANSGEPDAGNKSEDDKSTDDSKSKKEDDQESRTLSEDDWRRWKNFEEERDRLQGARRKAEEERDKAKADLADLQAKGADSDDAKKQITDLTGERDALVDQIRDLRIRLAFVTTPGYDWVDPEAALKLADLSKVEIDKNGKVHGIKVELDALAKSKPYLLKAKEEDDKENKQQQNTKSGDKPGSNKSGDEKSRQAAEAKLRAKFPALRR